MPPPKGTRWHPKSSAPHFFIILCGLWLLIYTLENISVQLQAIAEKLGTGKR